MFVGLCSGEGGELWAAEPPRLPPLPPITFPPLPPPSALLSRCLQTAAAALWKRTRSKAKLKGASERTGRDGDESFWGGGRGGGSTAPRSANSEPPLLGAAPRRCSGSLIPTALLAEGPSGGQRCRRASAFVVLMRRPHARRVRQAGPSAALTHSSPRPKPCLSFPSRGGDASGTRPGGGDGDQSPL